MNLWIYMVALLVPSGLDNVFGEEHEGEEEAAKILSRVRRVIGGENVPSGQWPWLVSIQGKIPTRTIFGLPIRRALYYCGASLINDRWLLTAAHCFPTAEHGSKGVTPRYWHARLGERELQVSVVDKIRGLIARALEFERFRDWYIHADRIIIHPSYNAADIWANDIALIRLRENVPADKRVLPEIQPVTLPTASDVSDGFPSDSSTCIMKGWGCTSRGGRVSQVAQQVELPKIPDSECSRMWHSSVTTRLCAGYNLERMGICSGDSGGPLVCWRNNRWVQAGIASFTSADRPGNVPGVFTRVSAYTRWIRDTIARN